MAKIDKLIQRMFIALYKDTGWTIKQIADQFGVKQRTVIAIVEKREQTSKCLYCGKELEQTPGHKQKEFAVSNYPPIKSFALFKKVASYQLLFPVTKYQFHLLVSFS